MKKITLAIVMVIAFVFSVWPGGSLPAHAQALCEFGLVATQTFICVDTASEECPCGFGKVSVCLNTLPPTVVNNLESFGSCCREVCGGMVVPEDPGIN
jgi:hypothetical protein